jgi:hypothetical protein
LQELAAVDVELSSVICRAVAREAARLKKASVISFHDFEKTPPLRELCAIVEKEHAIGSIAKVSTMITRGRRGRAALVAAAALGQADLRHRHGAGVVEDQNRICHARFVPDLRLSGQANRPRPNVRGGIGPPLAPRNRCRPTAGTTDFAPCK